MFLRFKVHPVGSAVYKNGPVNESGNFEPLHLSLKEKQNTKQNETKQKTLYPALFCEGLVCMKVAAKQVIFHALQQIFLTLVFTYY